MTGTGVDLHALDQMLSAASQTYTGPEAAREAGVDSVWAARLWRAAGFDRSLGERELSADDVRVLGAAADLVRQGRFDETELLQFARMFNLAAGPLADAAAIAIQRRQPLTDGPDRYLEDLDGSLAQFEDVLLHMWRRRLTRLLESGRTTERNVEGVGFADLVGFTSLVRRDDDAWQAALDGLEAIAFDVVARRGGRVVKTIGDEVMWVHPDPDGMVASCIELADAAAADRAVPPLRIGAAWGETVARRGDRFGTPVNLASRLVHMCRPGEALLSPSLGSHAPGARGGRPRWVHGVGWIRPARLRTLGHVGIQAGARSTG